MNLRFAAVLAGWLAALPTLAATNESTEPQIEEHDLARQLCELRPEKDFTNTSSLVVFRGKGKDRRVHMTPLRTTTVVGENNWTAVYETLPNTNAPDCKRLTITHRGTHPNQYTLSLMGSNDAMADVEIMSPFSDSDFWVADLGMEFFHWPIQKVLTNDMKSGQACKVLQSTNPRPSTNGYSRVVSWIDNDTLGIIQAHAYDTHGKLLKVFAVKEFKKLNGQWQLQEMEMRNVQTKSRTLLEFDLEKK